MMTKQSRFNLVGVSAGLLLVSCFSLLGCSDAQPKLEPEMERKQEKVKNVGDSHLTFNPRVDILFVVDDSGSMSEHQSNLSRNVNRFVAEVQKSRLLDYHIGVLTSSMDYWGSGNGKGVLVGSQHRFVTRNTPNGSTVLAKNLLVGTSGSGTEEFFSPVQAALTAPLINAQNAGFYRSDASLAIIFITDADDQSKIHPHDFYNFLLGLKAGDAKRILSYGVFIPAADRGCERSGEPVPDRIEEVMRLASGVSFGLCDPDFGMKLAGLAADLVEKVGKVAYLSRPPIEATIEVTFGTQVIPNDLDKGWTYDPYRNALVFGKDLVWTTQPPGTQIEINFTAAEYSEE